MVERIKVAVAGTGYFSQFHFDAWSRCAEVDLVAIADLDEKAAQAAAKAYGAEHSFADVAEMLDIAKPDLLDIVTPPPTHQAMIALAARHGIDCICQKPFCGDLETAEAATKLAERAGITLVVHENFRFQPWYQAAKAVLNEGRLGRIYQVMLRLRPGDGQGPRAYLDRQPYFQKMERFLVHETAIHLIDVLRYFFDEADSVWADLTRLNPVIAGEDNCLIVLNFADGVRGIIDGNRLSDHRAENCRRTMGEMLIEGENGVLSLNGDGELSFRAHGDTAEQSIVYEWRDHGFGGDCVYRFTRHVVDHFIQGAPLANTARDYLANLHIEEAVYASAADGSRRVL